MKRILLVVLLTFAVTFFAACGGGSAKTGSGGGGGGPVANSVALSVGPGPSDMTSPAGGFANILFANVTICQPGTSTCTTIDHVLVDTGSSGLRVLASELPSGFSLTTAASGSGSLYECLPFLDSYAWGNVVTADVEMAGEKASSVPVQLITNNTAPSACSGTVAVSGSSQVGTVNDLGAKGILGVGNFAADCGTYCTTVRSQEFYFSCTSTTASSCTQAATPLAAQVTNPVQLFATDNNGVVIQLGAANNGGSASGSGTMFFGIGTQSNNTPASGVTKIALDNVGNFTTVFKSTTYSGSFIDTGSNAYFFGTITNKSTLATSTGITACNVGTSSNPFYFYCPGSELSETASVASTATPATKTNVSFSVGNVNNLTGYALPDLAGTNTDGTSFDWGLPFFFGKTVYIGLEGTTSSLGSGLYFAF